MGEERGSGQEREIMKMRSGSVVRAQDWRPSGPGFEFCGRDFVSEF